MKVGDRVVCIETHKGYMESFHTSEHLVFNKVYTVSQSGYDKTNEYNWITIDNGTVMWSKLSFRKIEPNFTNALTHKLANDFIEEDSKVIETERERVLNLNAEF